MPSSHWTPALSDPRAHLAAGQGSTPSPIGTGGREDLVPGLLPALAEDDTWPRTKDSHKQGNNGFPSLSCWVRSGAAGDGGPHLPTSALPASQHPEACAGLAASLGAGDVGHLPEADCAWRGVWLPPSLPREELTPGGRSLRRGGVLQPGTELLPSPPALRSPQDPRAGQ